MSGSALLFDRVYDDSGAELLVVEYCAFPGCSHILVQGEQTHMHSVFCNSLDAESHAVPVLDLQRLTRQETRAPSYSVCIPRSVLDRFIPGATDTQAAQWLQDIMHHRATAPKHR